MYKDAKSAITYFCSSVKKHSCKSFAINKYITDVLISLIFMLFMRTLQHEMKKNGRMFKIVFYEFKNT